MEEATETPNVEQTKESGPLQSAVDALVSGFCATNREQVRKAAIAFGEAMRPAVESAAKALRQFGLAYYQVAQHAYRKEFGRLPGSERTARLRKKRLKVVCDWFSDYLAVNR